MKLVRWRAGFCALVNALEFDLKGSDLRLTTMSTTLLFRLKLWCLKILASLPELQDL